MFISSDMNNADLGTTWIRCMKNILENGKEVNDDNEKLLEICNLYFTISSISEDDPIIKEYADLDRISLMKEKYSSCNVLPGYKISYGKLIFDNNGVNQVEWLLHRLMNKPETKAATMTMHIPGQNELSCLSLLDFKIRDKQLNMSVIYRSQNVFASQPGNFIALNTIHQYLADQLQINKGHVEGIILSAHIYKRDVEAAKSVINEFMRKK